MPYLGLTTNASAGLNKNKAVQQHFWETADYAVNAILKYIPKGVKRILEPTYGRGGIGNVLEKHGYVVIKKDLYPLCANVKKMDYLTQVCDEDYDICIFNPPYCQKTAFLKRAVELGKPFIFMSNMTIMESEERLHYIKMHKLSTIILNRRVTFENLYGSEISLPSLWMINDRKARLYIEEIDNNKQSRFQQQQQKKQSSNRTSCIAKSRNNNNNVTKTNVRDSFKNNLYCIKSKVKKGEGILKSTAGKYGITKKMLNEWRAQNNLRGIKENRKTGEWTF
jgi:hypothetical protein